MRDHHMDVGRAIVRVAAGVGDDLVPGAAQAAAELTDRDVVAAVRTGAAPVAFDGGELDLSTTAEVARPLVAWLHEVDGTTETAVALRTVTTNAGALDVLFLAACHGRTAVGLAVVDPGVDDRTSQVVTYTALLAELAEQRALAEQSAAADRRQAVAAEHVMLGAASHELRTPLTIIMGLASTLELRHRQLEPDVVGELLGRMVSNACRMNELVEDLLAVAELRHDGEHVVRGRPGSLDELVTRALDGLEPDVRERLEVDVEPAEVVLDDVRVTRAVEHLVRNAATYAGPGTPIEVRVRRVPGGAVLSVLDHGHGVRPDLRDRIFDPFGRGEGLVSHSPGLGIGLSLVREVARALGGSAWVTDREDGDRGAAFHVRLRHPQAGAALPSPVRATLDQVTGGLDRVPHERAA